jgi:DNA mismatch endonuclease, patch repair protein
VTDTLTKEERSRRMSLVRGKDTRPEIRIRGALHRLGYRYRLHVRSLPGTPDLVFVSRKKVIFVHGCFWHRHSRCKLARMPKSRLAFWKRKLEGNLLRDEKNRRRLTRLGWRHLTVWECQLYKSHRVMDRITRFLDDGRGRKSK